MTSSEFYLNCDHIIRKPVCSVKISLEHEPVFSEADCRELDFLASNLNRATTLLTSDELNFLSARLNIYYWEYHTLFGPFEFMTPLMRKSHLIRITSLFDEIIRELSLLTGWSPQMVAPLDFEDSDALAEDRYNQRDILPAIQSMAEEARRCLSTYDDVDAARGEPPQPGLKLLLKRLGYEYGKTWGKNNITASRTTKNGGPSVRFIRKALQLIVKESVEPSTLYDRLRPFLSEVNTALSIKDPFYDHIFQECEALRQGDSWQR